MGDTRDEDEAFVELVDVPVVDGVATLPDGGTVTSTADVVRVPILRGKLRLPPVDDPDAEDDLD